MACTRQRRQISQPSRSESDTLASRLDMPNLVIGPGDQLASSHVRHRGGSVEARSPAASNNINNNPNRNNINSNNNSNNKL